MNAARIARLSLLFLAVSLLTRAYMIPVDVIDIDESLNITGSRVLGNGGLLYTDFADNKPPLLYVYYLAAQILFGRSLFAVHLFTALFTVPLTALACAAFYNYDRRGAIAGLLFLVYSAAFLAHDMHASHAELAMILPGAWALAVVRDEERGRSPARLFAAGILAGTGVLLKYQVIAWLAAIGLACVYECIRRKQYARGMLLLCAAAIGLALPLLAVFAYFAAHRGADQLIFWTVWNNLAYSANPILLREAVGRFAGSVLPFLLATLPLWWCAARLPQMEASRYRKVLLGASLLLSVPAVFLGFRFYPHYFIQFYVPLCLCAAPGVLSWLDPMSRKGRALVAYSAGMWALFALINAVLYYGNTKVYRETDPVFRRVAQRLREDSCYAGGTMFVWGYTPLYYHAKLPPASRFTVLPQSGLTGYISGNLESVRGKVPAQQVVHRDHWQILMSDLERNHATYIVDTSPAGIYRWNRYPISDFPLLQRYLEKRYEVIENMDGIVIYRRRGCVSSNEQ